MFRRHFLTAALALVVTSCAGSAAPVFAKSKVEQSIVPYAVLGDFLREVVQQQKIWQKSPYSEQVVRDTLNALLRSHGLSLPTEFENGTILHGLVEINNDRTGMRELHLLWTSPHVNDGAVEHVRLAWERVA